MEFAGIKKAPGIRLSGSLIDSVQSVIAYLLSHPAAFFVMLHK